MRFGVMSSTHRMIPFLVSFLFALPSQANDNSPHVAKIEAQIPKLLAKTKVPGLSFALIENGQVVYEAGFGVTRKGEGDTRVGKDTVFEAASLAKPVFAWRVLELIAEGRLDLDRPLSDYLDEPWIADPRLPQITARRVLSHQSGFPNWRPDRWTSEPKPLRIEFEPGSRFGYSGEGYMYLQAVVEKITGRPLALELEETVLQKLGMSSSSYIWRPDYEKTCATGHDRAGKERPKFKPPAAFAAGSLHTTAGDYARFLAAHFDPQNEPVRLLLEKTTPVERGIAWGLGWGLETIDGKLPGSPFFWHWGDNGSFKALVFGSRSEKRAIVCLTNGEAGLKACRPLIETVFPGSHPALKFRMLNY